MSDIPALDERSAAARLPEREHLVDREARNPWFRWLIHFGAPMGVSLAIHTLLFALLGVTTWAVVESERFQGEFEAGIQDDSDRLDEGFKWPEETRIEQPEADLRNLESLTDLSAISDIDVSELKPDSLSADSGLGVGESGRGDILGIGSGAGAAGTGGFGEGLGGSGRAGGGPVGFLGEQLIANRVVYVLDYSGSIVVVRDELVRKLKASISALKPPQAFTVIVFYGVVAERGDRAVTDAFKAALQLANQDSKRAFFDWIGTKDPQGGTEPLEALRRAIKLEPEVIFFLSDGYFEDKVVDEVRNLNKRAKARIYCMCLDEVILAAPAGAQRTTDGAKRLKRIADQNGGKLRIVTSADLEK